MADSKTVRFVPYKVMDGLWCVWDEVGLRPIEVGNAGSYVTPYQANASQLAFDKNNSLIDDWKTEVPQIAKLSDIRVFDLVSHMALLHDIRLSLVPAILEGVKERTKSMHAIAANMVNYRLNGLDQNRDLINQIATTRNAFDRVRKDAGL